MTGRAALPLAAPLVALAACAAARAGGPRPPPKVEHQGEMHAMFESGSAAGTVELEPLLARPHLYAVGPLADLAGEILVWDGTPFESRRDGDGVKETSESDATAPLLVWSYVSQWREFTVPDDAREFAALQEWLPKVAANLGLDAARPFAFLLIGAAESATLHVVSLPPGTKVTHEAHDAAKKLVDISSVPIEAVGFHATDARGVWTHHDSDVHVHLRTLFGGTMGHVEALTLAPGAIVKIAWR